jgi:hypothetical protein
MAEDLAKDNAQNFFELFKNSTEINKINFSNTFFSLTAKQWQLQQLIRYLPSKPGDALI